MDKAREKQVTIFVDLLMAVVFLAIGIKIWGSIMDGLKGLIPAIESPCLWGFPFGLCFVTPT